MMKGNEDRAQPPPAMAATAVAIDKEYVNF